MYYLITYSEDHGAPRNAVTSSPPAEWMYERLRWGQGKTFVLLFAIEIPEEEYVRLSRML